MGYKCTFMDNEVYKADDVNRMFSRLASQGVVLANSGNTLSDLNTAASELTTEGVQCFYDSCRLTEADGVYKIGEGVCFMSDGAAITFDGDGYEIFPPSDTYSYVYIKRNAPYNTIDVVVSDTEGEGDFVPIAEVDEDGFVYDRRVYSRAKINPTAAKTLKSATAELSIADGSVAVADMGTGDFSTLILGDVYRIQYGVKGTSPFVAQNHNAVALKEGETITVPLSTAEGAGLSLYSYFTKNGQNLEIGVSERNPYGGWDFHFDVI